MASVQARHARSCANGREWTPLSEAASGCTCPRGPTYYVVIREGTRNHKERVGKNKREAERALRKIGHEVDEGNYRPQQNIRFESWADRWLDSLERKATTIDSYRSTVAYAKQVLGNKIVRRITVGDIARFNTHLRERVVRNPHTTMGPSTRSKHLRVLGACLSSAVQHGYASMNPVSMLPKAEKPRPVRKEAAYFQNDELPRLFAELPEGLFRVLLELALKCGMREGELLALTWGDIDLTDAVIRVRRSVTSGHVSSPKNHELRDVDITPDVVDLLGGWWGDCGRPGDDAIVFPGDRGYLAPSTILRRELYPAMERAKIPREGPTGEKRTFHSLRHTFAKRALESGAQVTWLSRHLGHSSLQVTSGVYGHWERGERRRQARLLAGAFGI